MAVIEGYAEHVMDAVGEQVLPSVRELRRRLDERRRTRPVLIQVLERLLGLELKLRQYEEGKRFCDSVVAEGGLPALNRVWDSPESMPDLGELRDPSSWVERTAAAAV
jgi:putative hydrolase